MDKSEKGYQGSIKITNTPFIQIITEGLFTMAIVNGDF